MLTVTDRLIIDLRAFQAAEGISNREFARRAGVSEQLIRRLHGDAASLSLRKVRRLEIAMSSRAE